MRGARVEDLVDRFPEGSLTGIVEDFEGNGNYEGFHNPGWRVNGSEGSPVLEDGLWKWDAREGDDGFRLDLAGQGSFRPEPFYSSLGFVETGEVDDGENVMKLLL